MTLTRRRVPPGRKARLDISLKDFAKLPVLGTTERNELIHGLMWWPPTADAVGAP
jgi:hypothetical protein